ncbi:type IV pilin protein [Acinetobacter sp. ANC 3832]|uniref:type IV pilin protein n=1 Tax=Acinetobacter sp. ANC 3832 TaxID=1977874 RepID=UPI000A34055B|nr:prepilin-type N-terminal cleavage/methylation domain-containing protein [Acinetobacter sp. ANC 3832]OTG96323.1 pilus assembly protein PilE [Acinetobacter sp. ANC 3832]
MVNIRHGFTLIEMMIVVVIIGILATIAYPSYQEYVRRTKRVDMQVTMVELAAQIQRYKIANFTLEGASLNDLGLATGYPLDSTKLYNVNINWLNAAGIQQTVMPLGSNRWVLTAEPINSSAQFSDGHIVLNFRGERCWIKGTDKNLGTPCVPSATSNWDGK